MDLETSFSLSAELGIIINTGINACPRLAARNYYVSAMSNPEFDVEEIQNRAESVYNMNEFFKQCNQRKSDNVTAVLSFAEEFLHDTNIDEQNIKDVDDDWLLDFMDKAQNVSKEDVQKLWGAILAKQFEGGAVSRQLLRVLYEIGYSETMTFTKLVSYALMIETKNGISEPLPAMRAIKDFEDKQTTVESIKRLIGFGLLDATVILEKPSNIKTVRYYNQIFDYDNYYRDLTEEVKRVTSLEEDPLFDSNLSVSFCNPPVKFTPLGKELFAIVQTDFLDGYFKELIFEHYDSQSLKAIETYGRNSGEITLLKMAFDLDSYFHLVEKSPII